MTIHLYQHDLPDDLDLGPAIAIDTETLGLNLQRDRLCLVQLSSGDGTAYLVQIAAEKKPCPNLRQLLANQNIEKLFHYARFDLAMLTQHIGVVNGPVFCTKIASKLCRTYTDKHGLSELCKELLNMEISKQQQSSNWGARDLSEAQLSYAAGDVLYLHALRDKLVSMLTDTDRMALAQSCFSFLQTRIQLDLNGFETTDIFAH